MSDPLSGVRWVPAADNPFGVDLLDCRSLAQSMIAMTQDSGVLDSFTTLRDSSGELEYRARIVVHHDGVDVIGTEARRTTIESDPSHTVAAVDYLIRSHVYQ